MRRDSSNNKGLQVGAVGIGTLGTITIDYLISSNAQDIQFISIDSDIHSPSKSSAQLQISLDTDITQRLEIWEKTKMASRAAYDARREIKNALTGIQILYIIAGLGGATGSGALPIVAKIARELGIYSIVIVTRPVGDESETSARIARKAIEVLETFVDSLIVLPTNHLKTLPLERSTSNNTFQTFAHILFQTMLVISEFVNCNGLINLDLANLKSILFNKGGSLTTIGTAKGKSRAQMAAQQALFCPQMGLSIHGARGLLINIRASDSLNLWETQTISNIIKNSTYMGAEYVVGVILDEAMGDKIKVSVLATGFAVQNMGGKPRSEPPPVKKELADATLEMLPQPSPEPAALLEPKFSLDSIIKWFHGTFDQRVENLFGFMRG